MHYTRGRNPVAKAVRTPAFRQRVVPDYKKYHRVPKHVWRKEA